MMRSPRERYAMQYRNGSCLLRFPSVLVPVALCGFALLAPNANIPAATPQDAPQTTKSQPATPSGDKRSRALEKPQESNKREASIGSGPVNARNKEVSLSPRESNELAMSLLEGVLVGTDRITPVEYKVLTQVEAATLLWRIDQDRALAMLKGACETMRDLREKDADKSINSKQRRLRFLVYLKIARLKPELVKDLALNKSSDDKSTQAMSGDWSEEARAVMTIADEQVEKNPTLAVQLVKQTFALGQVDWVVFLKKLSASNGALSEQVAITVIDRLSSSSITPIYLLNLRRFVLTPERSTQLKQRFFEALASRLRRDISPAVPSEEVNIGLVTAQDALGLTAEYPRWQVEFEGIISGFQELLAARSAPAADARNSKTIPIPMMDDVKAGDTREIAEAIPRVERIKESRARDSKYQEMATKAASSSDLRLAEEIISKIEDEAIRRDANLSVYSPFVRKAINESDWTGAREYASKIVDPLGRTLVLDQIARGMARSNKDKQSAKDVYDLAAYRLRRESPTEDVAKAFLILAKSLSTVDPDESLYAASWAVYILNRLTRNGELMGDVKVGSALAWWVSLPTFRHHDEVLDLTEMIGPFFREMAKRDPEVAQTVAHGFVDQGLYSIAQLGIVRALLEKAGNSKSVVDQKQASGKSASKRN